MSTPTYEYRAEICWHDIGTPLDRYYIGPYPTLDEAVSETERSVAGMRRVLASHGAAAARSEPEVTYQRRLIVGWEDIADPGKVTIYQRVGPDGVNGYAKHTHDGRLHTHDGGASPHRHPLYPGDDRDQTSPEPARLVDGLTVGARYYVTPKGGGEPHLCEFTGRPRDRYVFRLSTYGSAEVSGHPNDVARGDIVITDLGCNRVDYWAEQAAAFIAEARAHGMDDEAMRAVTTHVPGNGWGYEPATFHALPRVLDEQESTR